MQQYEMASFAVAQKARSERLYMHYALTLDVLLALCGSVLVILGLGAHLDIVVSGSDLEARFVNASPGVALWLISAAVFALSKPRRLDASASHSEAGARADGPSAARPPTLQKFDDAPQPERQILERTKKRIQDLADDTDQAEQYLISVEERITDLRDRAMALQQSTPAAPTRTSGGARVFYQEDVKPTPEKSESD